MQANIDGDLIAYRCSASVKDDEPLDIALYRTDQLMRQILEETSSSHFRCFLTGKENFRRKINPLYKANRTQEPPKYLQECKQFLIEEWKAESSLYLEADDLLGIHQAPDTVICTLDKDLLMVPGQHYSWQIAGSNWVREARWETTKAFDGIRYFYQQMLVGDTSDNILGIKGIGPKKAFKLIDHLDTEEDMFNVVYDMYDDPQRFLVNAMCLWILQKPGETWVHRNLDWTLPDPLRLEVDLMLESTKYLMDDTLMGVI